MKKKRIMKSADNVEASVENCYAKCEHKNYSISKVARIFNEHTWTIRLWIDRFNVLKPRRDSKGNLFFSPADVEKIRTINRLTKEKGMTLKNVKKHLDSETTIINH
jgi:DNA-binding transcriptional MerR regulator